MGLPHTVSEITAISVENQIFPTSGVFNASLNGFLLELGTGAWVKKLELCGYRAEKGTTAKTALMHSVMW